MRRGIGLLVFFGLVAACLWLPACTSMKKARIEEALLALPKNAPVRDAGLEKREVEMTLAGERVQVDMTWIHAGSPAAGEKRPVIVLVHSTPSSLFSWSELVFGSSEFRGLAADCDVYALDVIGHGTLRTAMPPYSFQLCADYVAGFLDALDLNDVTLVGHSYGGEFAWRAALDHPQRIARLVLIDSAGVTRADDEWLPEEETMRSLWGARFGWLLNSRDRIRGALQPHFKDPVAFDRAEEMFLLCENSDNWRAMIDLVRDENGSRGDELSKLALPTLLVWGEHDIAYTVERFARRFERAIPNAKLVLVPDTGHYPAEESPARVADIVREFVQR